VLIPKDVALLVFRRSPRTERLTSFVSRALLRFAQQDSARLTVGTPDELSAPSSPARGRSLEHYSRGLSIAMAAMDRRQAIAPKSTGAKARLNVAGWDWKGPSVAVARLAVRFTR